MKVRAAVPGLSVGETILPRDVSHYLGRVLRLRRGDTFLAFDPSTRLEGLATVEQAEDGTMIIHVADLRTGRTLAQREVTWMQGIAKGDKCDAIVRDVTELGATCFVPFSSSYGTVKLDAARADKKRARWKKIAQEAARQCGRVDSPIIKSPCAWSDAIASVANNTTSRFCLYERANEPLFMALAPALANGSELAFAAGPEGGFSEGEIAIAQKAGWRIVSVGEFILRTETVAAAVLGAVRIWG